MPSSPNHWIVSSHPGRNPFYPVVWSPASCYVFAPHFDLLGCSFGYMSKRERLMRRTVFCAAVLFAAVFLVARDSAAQNSIARRGKGHNRCDDARGDRRGVEPRADRENTSRGQRWHRPVPDRRPAAWHVFGDIHVDRVPNRRSPGHPTAGQLHGPGQRRPADRRARRNTDGHWRVADRRRHQQPVVGRARSRRARRDSDVRTQPADARGPDSGVVGHICDARSVPR